MLYSDKMSKYSPDIYILKDTDIKEKRSIDSIKETSGQFNFEAFLCICIATFN